ncbi:MAG: hypothetical protein QT11_C0001G0974 [archaeon GW2011_AR20]|nr:MAG: hypothetical protein QT11_C0001G0974 [archaeon GW2011_AR20]
MQDKCYFCKINEAISNLVKLEARRTPNLMGFEIVQYPLCNICREKYKP